MQQPRVNPIRLGGTVCRVYY